MGQQRMVEVRRQRSRWGEAKARDGQPAALRGRISLLYVGLIAANLGAWAWALIVFRGDPMLLGTALLAYGLGLRHAVDADHIAAIDNVTRKLLQDGRQSVTVGLFFSLGHSTVVAAASAILAAAASLYERHVDAAHGLGGILGTLVSAGFLYAIAIMNIVVLAEIYRKFGQVKREGRYVEEELGAVLARGGVLSRILRPIFRLVRASWHMYPLGLLFGLGFDTASEVSLLGISATEAGRGLSVWSILVFPALFTVGMSLIDSTDGVLMLRAYGWAFVKPIRKLYYNFTVTLISVAVAIVIGTIEILALIGGRLRLAGSVWEAARRASEHFGSLGYLVIAIFIGCWALSMVIYRIKGYELEAGPSAP